VFVVAGLAGQYRSERGADLANHPNLLIFVSVAAMATLVL
jgi:hypothetical protein